MNEGLARLRDLQQSFACEMYANAWAEDVPRLHVMDAGERLHVDFYGSPHDELYDQLLPVMAEPAVASCLASLWLRGPDEGANGTRNWDLTPLVDPVSSFPQLQSVIIEQTRPGDHNQSVVAQVYDEDGVLARLLAKAPGLRSLTTPSAPNAEFFGVGERPLQYLSVDVGYDHQDFIRNLSRSSEFLGLHGLEFGDTYEPESDREQPPPVPVEQYQELFASPVMEALGLFVWRNPSCTAEEIRALKASRPGLQLKVVRTSARYW